MDSIKSFNVIDYLSGLTGFIFDKAVLERVAIDNCIEDAESRSDITEETKDKCEISLLEIILVTPNSTASSTNTHGAWTRSVGQQIISDEVRENVKRRLRLLYKKWDMEDELNGLDEGNLSWIDENEYPPLG